MDEFFAQYCSSVCKAKCCQKGKIVLTTKDQIATFKIQITPRLDGQAELSLEPSCPMLGADYKCTVFNSPHRPKICGEYPFFKRGNTLFVSTFCQAIKNNEIDLSQFKDVRIVFQ